MDLTAVIGIGGLFLVVLGGLIKTMMDLSKAQAKGDQNSKDIDALWTATRGNERGQAELKNELSTLGAILTEGNRHILEVLSDLKNDLREHIKGEK